MNRSSLAGEDYECSDVKPLLHSNKVLFNVPHFGPADLRGSLDTLDRSSHNELKGQISKQVLDQAINIQSIKPHQQRPLLKQHYFKLMRSRGDQSVSHVATDFERTGDGSRPDLHILNVPHLPEALPEVQMVDQRNQTMLLNPSSQFIDNIDREKS